MHMVRGVIELPSEIKRSVPAQVYIRVEEVSRADALAQLLGQIVLRNLTTSDFLRGTIPFELPVADPGEGALCTVRVHLDLDGNGVVSSGDYVSAEHIPVLDSSAPSEPRIKLRRVS
jgi:hypothetical protein